jgi:hypothetical protein
VRRFWQADPIATASGGKTVMGKTPPAPAVLLACILTAVAAPVLAGAPDREDPAGIVVVGDDGENLILQLDEGRWLRIREEGGDGRRQTVEIDLSQLGAVVQDAMDEVQQSLRGLDELQLDLRLGADQNSIRIFDDQDEVFLDLGDMISEITGSIAESLGNMDWEGTLDRDGLRELRHAQRLRDRRDQDRRELEESIEQMKDEIARLQRELRRLHQRDRH